MTQTVTGLFDRYMDAAAAVRELEAAGVPHADISIVANNIVPVDRDDRTSNAAGDAGKGAGVGAAVGGGAGLLTGLGLMAIPGVGPVVAAGWLIATAVGAAAGAVAGGAVGGMIGALTASGVSEDDANVYAEGVRRGGTLVTAHVDDQRASQAREILQRSRSVDLAARRNAYREAGWSRFDEAAPAYTDEQVRRERQLYS
jgi:heat induced stress protein YflT